LKTDSLLIKGKVKKSQSNPTSVWQMNTKRRRGVGAIISRDQKGHSSEKKKKNGQATGA
jgi:hypothetical protein